MSDPVSSASTAAADKARAHLNAILGHCGGIDTILDAFRETEFPDEERLVRSGVDRLQEIIDHARALAALVDRDSGGGHWWGVAPRSVDYARRHPWTVIPCMTRLEAEQVRDEQDDREHWVIVQVGQVMMAADT